MTEIDKWAESGWLYTPSSSQDLSGVISRLLGRQPGRQFHWRGHADASWSLESTMARQLRGIGAVDDDHSLRTAEKNLIKKARMWPAHEFGGSVSDQMVLAIFQHHGAPTGLLDLTTDPMTALWFACDLDANSDSIDKHGVLLAFDVSDWPSLQTESFDDPYTWSHLEDPLGAPYRNALAERSAFLINPTRPTGRMLAQRGKLFRSEVVGLPGDPIRIKIEGVTGRAPSFSIQDVLKEDSTIEGITQLPFVAILLSPEHKAALRPQLEGSYGLKRSHLFPEISGFIDAVRMGNVPLIL